MILRLLWVVALLGVDKVLTGDVVFKDNLTYDPARNNYTGNDLIGFLSTLANEEIQPRLRFPSNDNDDYIDDSRYQDSPNTGEIFVGQNINNYQSTRFQNPNGPQFYSQPQQNPQNGNYDQQYQNYVNQGQFQRPYKKRPKKQRPSRYRPQFPISQDPLDPYYQNYPPFGPYQQNDPNYPSDPNYPQYLQDFQAGLAQGQYTNQDQSSPFASFMNALSSIAKNDDQHCVPRLLCEVAAGGNPSYRQSSFLPSFLNTESLFTILSALTGSVSPLLVFGRAALLGVTSQGRPTSCRYAYPECPRDPDRLVEYLNNHNGGFFRFFEGLNGNQIQQDGSTTSQQQNQFGFNQLSQLFGQNQGQQNQFGLNQLSQLLGQNQGQNNPQSQQQNQFGLNQLTQLLGQIQSQNNPQSGNYNQRPNYYQDPGVYNQRPNNYNQRPLYNPNAGIPNQRPQNYQNSDDYYPGLYNQRPSLNALYNKGGSAYYGRYPVQFDFQNRAKDNKTVESVGDEAEARILNKRIVALHDYNRDVDRIQNLKPNNDLHISLSYQDHRIVENDNRFPDGVFKFPENSGSNINSIPDEQYTKNGLRFPSDSSDYSDINRKRPKALAFPSSDFSDNQLLYFPKPLPYYDHSKMIFPDRTGTGNLKFDSDKLNQNYNSNIYGNDAQYYGQSGNKGSYYTNSYQQPSTNNNNYYSNYQTNRYQSSSPNTYSNSQTSNYQPHNKKRYVYIVRGNGDPNHPEIVEEPLARQSKANEDTIEAEPSVSTNRRNGSPWTFPSPYQGVMYNDRSYDTGY